MCERILPSSLFEINIDVSFKNEFEHLNISRSIVTLRKFASIVKLPGVKLLSFKGEICLEKLRFGDKFTSNILLCLALTKVDDNVQNSKVDGIFYKKKLEYQKR